MASVIEDICYDWRVPLYPSVGFSSKSFLYEAARSIADDYYGRKTMVMLYLGDYDPAGCIIDEAIEEGITLRLFELGKMSAPIDFRRIAVNEDQITKYDLPTKPRKPSEVRKPEIEMTVEIESMPVELIKGILSKHIESVLPATALQDAIERENESYGMLSNFSKIAQSEERDLAPSAK